MKISTYNNPSVQIAYERHGDLLFRIAYSVLYSREDAEDAVHDVFVKYVNKPPAFREYEHEKAWFLRVTINHCYDLARRKKIRSYISLEEVLNIPMEQSQTSEVLEYVLTLPEKYRISIVLHYYEGYSVEQTAKILGIGKSAVKMRLARGREMLKNEMGSGE